MAEIVGIVASGAGLTSLALQLLDLAKRLRQRCENLRDLQDTTQQLLDDVEWNITQLHIIEADHSHILEAQRGPVLLERCRRCGSEVAKQLESLIQKLSESSSSSSRLHAIKVAFNSKTWKTEVAELKMAVANFKQEIIVLICLLTSQQCVWIRAQLEAPKPVAPPQNENKASTTSPSITQDERPNFSSTGALGIKKRTQAPYCAVRHCHCSCHSFEQLKGRYWFFEYTSIASMFAPCDHAECTTRRYRIGFRIALSRLRMPWAVALGVSMDSELGRYHLKPVLEVQRVVRYTAPGFDTLFELSEGGISWEVARPRFDALYQSDPTFVKQVDPEGRGFIEKIMQHGLWEAQGWPDFGAQRQLLIHFTRNYHMRLRLDSVEVVYGCVMDHDPAVIFGELIALGFDFSDVPRPNSEKWPKPYLDDVSPSECITVIPSDPFFMELTRALVSHEQDLSGATQLQEAILLGRSDTCLSLIQNLTSFDAEVNFLGQTPLHLAVKQPTLIRALLDSGHNVDVQDKNGFTPLMYAASLGLRESATILIERGADLFAKDRVDGRDFIEYMAIRLHWSLIWDIVDAVEARDRDLLLPLFSRIKLIQGPPLFESEGVKYLQDFWKSILQKLGTWDVRFEDGSTLLHIVQTPKLAKCIVNSGYTLFNQQDNNGEHCLFAMTRFLDPSLFQMCVDKGASVNLRNKNGMTVMHRLLSHLRNPNAKVAKAVLSCLDTLLDAGAHVNVANNWVCVCSSHGCLAVFEMSLKTWFLCRQMLRNPFWLFEWLHMLEERGKTSEAKAFAITLIRREKFDALGLMHQGHSRWDGVSVSEDDDDVFWSVKSQLKLDSLDSDMRALESASYKEVKLLLLQEIRHNSDDGEPNTYDKGANAPDEKKSKPDTNSNNEGFMKPLDCLVNYSSDRLYTKLDLALMDPFDASDYEEMPAEECIDMCFSEFVTNLQFARGEKFSDRLPMLRQIANTLNLSFFM
ncbi:hypothetical protein B0T10DRAFT_552525 [Thelonectria olida]|uniref:Uncharacterized protein n=1 Tax=Thelonectria olida TaxID=1576542 RepID=A0A9P9AIX7_9HYPO|nr:hypothetical protein B0T10DRAFT_552525 [Thelonectria olida]